MSDIVPQTPGIYAIVNLTNQKRYIGSAKNLKQRKNSHFNQLKAKSHSNGQMQYDYDLNGADAFRFDILEIIECVENLIIREQHYIDTLNPEYNRTLIARRPNSIMNEKPITTRYPPNLVDAIKRRAKESGRSFNSEVIYELLQYQENPEPTERQALTEKDLQSTETAMEEVWKRYATR